jgi:hypothetical protein
MCKHVFFYIIFTVYWLKNVVNLWGPVATNRPIRRLNETYFLFEKFSISYTCEILLSKNYLYKVFRVIYFFFFFMRNTFF